MKESKRKNLSVPEFKKLKEKHIEKSFNECYQAIKKLKAHVEHRDFMAQLKIAFPIALLASAMSVAMVYFIF